MAQVTGVATSKRALWLFVLAFVITTAELCWWVTFNVQQSAKLAAQEALLQQRDCHLAQALADHGLFASLGPDPSGLQSYFPGLEFSSDGRVVGPKPHLLSASSSAHSAHVRMFVAEGAFFFFMVLLGAGLIARTIRREVGVVRQQANFLNAVTHELKSPLAAMRLYIETLERRQVDPQTLARYVATMRAECDRLDVLVGHVLTLARMESDKPQAAMGGAQVRHNLHHQVAQVMAQRHNGRQAQKPPIDYTPGEQAVDVAMEEASLRTVLRNLLDNACKYGAQGKAIVVRVWSQEGRAWCSVQDFGIGIAAHEQAHIFERFYRVGDEMVRRHEGSGLGLYLVRMLLQDCGGTIEVASDGLGRGATFRVSLPLAPHEARDHATT